MPISEEVMKSGLDVFIAGLKNELLPIAKVILLEEQRTKYEETLADIMKRDGTSREEVVAKVGEFAADEAKAEISFHGYVDNGITNRLKLAIARYQAMNPIGCIRSIVLAMETLAFLEGKNETFDRQLREVNDVLWGMVKPPF
jgi:hypothetical protein